MPRSFNPQTVGLLSSVWLNLRVSHAHHCFVGEPMSACGLLGVGVVLCSSLAFLLPREGVQMVVPWPWGLCMLSKQTTPDFLVLTLFILYTKQPSSYHPFFIASSLSLPSAWSSTFPCASIGGLHIERESSTFWPEPPRVPSPSPAMECP